MPRDMGTWAPASGELAVARAQWPSYRGLQPDEHRRLRELTERLVGDYHERLPAGTVLRCVARALEDAHRGGAGPDEVPAAVEQLARQRIECRIESGVWPVRQPWQRPVLGDGTVSRTGLSAAG